MMDNSFDRYVALLEDMDTKLIKEPIKIEDGFYDIY